MTEFGERAVSALGWLSMMTVAWAFSADRKRVPWKTVGWGLTLQFGLAVILLKTPVGHAFFIAVEGVVGALNRYTRAGVSFVFGDLVPQSFSFALEVLPLIVVMGSVFAILYHLGLIQRLVALLARWLTRSMGTSGAESLAAVTNLFLGMTESALVVRPYLARMTRSELFLLMTLGMATVAGSVLVAYVQMLGGGAYAGHLVTASLLSAPAGILIAKIMIPETESPESKTSRDGEFERETVNVIDAAAQGALAGMRLAFAVGALLVAFVALVALVNDVLGAAGSLVGVEGLSLQRILGLLLAPVAWLMGIPWEDAVQVGGLLGVKTILNEFIAYVELAALVEAGNIQQRSAVIASYALCGFANLGSLAILLGGIGGLVPERRPEIARFGLLSILSGSLATFMTACVAGMLL
ncbi:NupC/NupG family nucleoside CNT transporter [Myxococcota bacterium]|nr:NupC/NupG family nucleoside CNT transporter [Myxococcota bacterium]